MFIKKAPDQNRTDTSSLEGYGSTIELQAHFRDNNLYYKARLQARVNGIMRPKISQRSIPEKANKILNLILVVIVLILAKLWTLTILQHDEGIEASQKPPRKVISLKPERATIRDRFNIPLALNKVQYNAAVSYAQIKVIPSISYEMDANGKKIKKYKRKEYIANLSRVLGKELSLDSARLEDLIHSKAALLNFAPLTIKEDLSENEYFRLRMLEKDYPGLLAEKTAKRTYPQNLCGCDVVGYMGAISKDEFEKIMSEMHRLKEYLKAHEEGTEILEEPEVARRRLKDLQEKAYTITDYVGKSGVEGYFDATLRGFLGKQVFFSDIRGHLLRELPESKPSIPGERLLLTISSELQEYCEALLAENEVLREGKSTRVDKSTYTYVPIKQPWIKGGCIIAMDPNNGEILALASYPRFDPNDFIPTKDPKQQRERNSKVYRWLENEPHIAEIWNQKETLKRERYSFSSKNFYDESKILTWEAYLHFILDKNHPVQEVLITNGQIQHALKAERNRESISTKLSLYDQMLLLDLYRVALDTDRFSKDLSEAVGKQTLSYYRQINCAFAEVQALVQARSKQAFHEDQFATWRADNQTAFLQEKRALEKLKKSYPKPYIDYLDREEKEQFDAYWQANRLSLIAECLKEESDNENFQLLKEEYTKLGPILGLEYLATLRTYEDLNRPLLGKYQGIRSDKGVQLEKHLAAAFYPKNGFGYGRSFAFRQATQVGSVFKLVSAFAALVQPYKLHYYPLDHKMNSKELNPLTIIDDLHLAKGENARHSMWNVGYTIDGKSIPQYYKGGRIPKSQHSHIGLVNLSEAIEASSNPYFSLLAGEVLQNPSDLLETAKTLSFGSKTGINLPGEIKGKLPEDILHNKTGLYALAIGQHSIVSTPLQVSVMLGALANKGRVLQPNVVLLQAGKQLLYRHEDIFFKNNYPYQEALEKIGIYFPLFTEPITTSEKSLVSCNPSRIARTAFLPESVRNYLLEAMKRVIHGSRGTARSGIIRSFSHRPQMIQDFNDLSNYMVGKTSTSEMLERSDLSQDGLHIVNHIGFSAISFEDESFEKPELVIVVYLRYGDYGKEAAPLAAQVIKKWREIKAK